MIKKLKENLASAFNIVAVLWIVHFVNMMTSFNLNNYGIRPRNISGLVGIPLAPFLHANMAHLLSNSVPLFVLLVLLFSFNGKIAAETIFSVALASGLGVWLFGSAHSLHVGASGIVFGLIGFLIFGGMYRRDIPAILVSVLVLVLYGGAILSLLIVIPGISWTGHAFGFLGGVYAAKSLR